MKRIIFFALLFCGVAYASVTVTVNGSSYTIPQVNERGWGTNVTTWIQAISGATLQKSGGSFPLTAQLTFGSSFGLTMVDANTKFIDDGDATKIFKLQLSSLGTGTTRTMTVPDRNFTVNLGTDISSGAATASQVLTADGSGNSSWVTPGTVLTDANLAQNYGFTTSVGTNAMTVTLKDNAGSTPSGGSPAKFAFRSSTAATGSYLVRSVTGALSVVIASGATLGLVSGQDQYIYIYAIDNAGTVELGVSGMRHDDGTLKTTVTMSGSSTSLYEIYTTTGRSSVPIRLVGRILSNQTVSGTYAANATEVSVNLNIIQRQDRSIAFASGGNGTGSTNTKILKWSSGGSVVGDDISYTSSATNGDSFTINRDGLYSMHLTHSSTGGDAVAIRKNLTTGPGNSDYGGNQFAYAVLVANTPSSFSATAYLRKGDVIRASTDNSGTQCSSTLCQFYILRIGD